MAQLSEQQGVRIAVIGCVSCCEAFKLIIFSDMLCLFLCIFL